MSKRHHAHLMRKAVFALLGEPRHVNGHEWRYGKRGSLSVLVDGEKVGQWYDHERGEGGGMLDLVQIKLGLGRGDAVAWLSEHLGGQPDLNVRHRSTVCRDVNDAHPDASASLNRHADGDDDPNGASHHPGQERVTRDRGATIAAYDYVDEEGALLFQVVRFEPKEFRQRKPKDGGGWEWNVRGVRQVPYRLGKAARLRLLRLPDLPPKGGVSDWLAAGATEQGLLRLANSAEEIRPKSGNDPDEEEERREEDGRPVIRIVNGKVHHMVDEAEEAILASGLAIFQGGSSIVRPGVMAGRAWTRGRAPALQIIELTDPALMEAIGRAAAWEKFDARSRKWVLSNVPATVVRVYRSRVGGWRLPRLAGIINAPTLRQDGSILDTPGYDETTGLLLDLSGIEFPAIPDKPTRQDAVAALHLLRDVMVGFSFVTVADRAVAYSAVLTACIRRSLTTAPLHAFTAPTAGTGKSHLVDVASVVASGERASVIAQGKSEEETEKRLASLLLAGALHVAIDNCDMPLGGDFLCQALTQPEVRARILGRSVAPTLPTQALVTATGNNLMLLGDMTRRAVLCSLDAKEERPELRKFDFDPIARILEDRGRYVVAALTVLRAYHVAGRPCQTQPLGSFEDWSGLVRGTLLWLGEADPCDTMEVILATDPSRERLQAVMAQWRLAIGPERVSASEIIERATEQMPGPNGKPEYVHPEFREALLVAAVHGGAISGRNLGNWLKHNKNRPVDGFRIVDDGKLKGYQVWRVVAADAV